MVKEARQITERTLIPISLVIVLIGGIFFMARMDYRTEANEKKYEELKSSQAVSNQEVKASLEELNRNVGGMREDLAVVKSTIRTFTKGH